MFFAKTKINENTVLNTELTAENVFTVCPDCGREVRVDLMELAADGELDLSDTAVCCPECSKRRWEKLERTDVNDEDDGDDISVLLDSISQSVSFLNWALGKVEEHEEQ